MNLLKIGFVTLIGLLPMSASAATIFVEFSGFIYESYDENFDDISGTYSTMEGFFYVDTATASSGGAGNFEGAVWGMETRRDGVPLLWQSDFTCTGQCTNNTFVSASAEASVYLQDFFVGNLNLDLQPAGGVSFNNDLSIFQFAAQGDVGDWFDISNSEGSVQVDGEDYFQLYDLAMTEVPVPAAAWLFLSALSGLVVAKRKKA